MEQNASEKSISEKTGFFLKGRILFSFLLIPLAFSAIVYGISFNTIEVSRPTKLALRETKVIFDTTIGGLQLTESGHLRRTYSGDKAPTLCPT